MAQYVYRDSNGNFRVRSNAGNTLFHVYTPDTPAATGLPGQVASFSYTGDNVSTSCSASDTISFNWTAPADNGGSPITGYKLRRIYTQFVGVSSGVPAGYSSAFAGTPNFTTITNFDAPCGGGAGASGNPITVGNITSMSVDSWECGYHSFQIAAVNANGTGPWYPSTTADLSTEGRGWVGMGIDGISYNNSGGLVTVTYTSDNSDCGGNFQNASGTLLPYGGGGATDTYSGFTQGSVSFTTPSAGWYYATVVETFTTVSGSCQQQQHGCHVEPIYIS